jgi:hypothetical protein
MSAISAMSSAVQYAQAGIQRGMNGLTQDAQAVAYSNVSGMSGDITSAVVDSLQQKLMVEASVDVLKIANQTLGSLINVKA